MNVGPERTAEALRVRLGELARLRSEASPVVSVYLDTRWTDEHQRERARVFLRRELARVRAGAPSPDLAEDLAWVEARGERVIEQDEHADAGGIALFACRSLGLREVLPVRTPFENTFVVGDRPAVGPLAALGEDVAPTLIVFVDGQSARLIPLHAAGRGEEVTLAHDVSGRHRRGGWALLAQSRYQRHLEAHRAQHFEAVAEALGRLVAEQGIERIVLAGEARALAVFRRHLPSVLAARVVGTVAGARHESAATLVARAEELMGGLERNGGPGALAGVLVEAAKGGRAVAGPDETLEAVGRGAVRRLYVLRGFDAPGRACLSCGALAVGDASRCSRCGGETKAVRLGEAVLARVLETGGAVDVVDAAPELARVGGLAARLRYPL